MYGNEIGTESKKTLTSKKKAKHFSAQEVTTIKPIGANQTSLFKEYHENPDLNFFLAGSPGTGKTFLSLYLALKTILKGDTNFEKITIIRSIVPTREIGYLPGSIEEKVEIYEDPYVGILAELAPTLKFAYDTFKDSGLIEFFPSSYLRGITLTNTIVIVDECQNMTYHELSSIITRVGKDCKIFFCGDLKQSDLIVKKNDQSGFIDFLDVIETIPEYFSIFHFNHNDIVRSGLVKAFIIAEDNITKLPKL